MARRLANYNYRRGIRINPVTKLPRAGIIWYLTSPKGKTGWLYDRWKKGDKRFPGHDLQQYLSLRVRTVDNPLLDQDTLKDIMAGYSDRQIAQELEGEFLDDQNTEFNLEDVKACYDPDDHHVRKILDGVLTWRDRHSGKKRSLRSEMGLTEDIERYELDPLPGRRYLASWDLGKKPTAKGRNATAGMVFDITELPWTLCAYRYEEGQGYLPAMGWIEEWQRKYSSGGVECYSVIDASGKGDVVNEWIEAEKRFQLEGLVYNSVLKPNMIQAGKIAVERGYVRFPFIKRMVDQLATYVQADKELAQDITMCFIQAMYKAREITGVAGARSVALPRAALSSRAAPGRSSAGPDAAATQGLSSDTVQAHRLMVFCIWRSPWLTYSRAFLLSGAIAGRPGRPTRRLRRAGSPAPTRFETIALTPG